MNCAVIGAGRFGLFWSSVLAHRHNVTLYNRTPKPSLDLPPGVQWTTLDVACRSDAVFICTAISSVPQVARSIAPLLLPTTTVIDTCSVKVQPLEQLIELLPKQQPILGTHPMFGPDSAIGGHKGLPLVLSAVEGRSSEEKWRPFFEDLGLVVHPMTPEDHDREASYSQGLTHLVGRLLEKMELKSSSIATLGYKRLIAVKDQTCNDPWQLFVDLNKQNPYSPQMRDHFQRALNELLQELDRS